MADNEVLQKVMDAGYTKPLLHMHKQDMLSTLAVHYCLLNVKAELDQLCEGLETLGLLSAIREYPQLFQCLFVSEGNCLTAGTVHMLYYLFLSLQFLSNIIALTVEIKRLLKQKQFSEKGSSSRREEETTYIYFCHYLEDLEGLCQLWLCLSIN